MATGSQVYGFSNSFYLSGSSTSFLGSSSMVSFEDANNSNTKSSKNKRSFFQSFEQEDNNGDDQDYDEYFNQSGKKRRLTLDQLNFLEKSFIMDNKLEPDRKSQLAKVLGLQPRQVAIWFQNRRARWKTKQMEKDYDVLQESFNALKANYESLFQEKENLKSQVACLSEEFGLKQKVKDMSVELYKAILETPTATSISESEESKVSVVASKQDEYSTLLKLDNGTFDSDSTSTKKGDLFETDSHYYYINDGSTMHSPHLEHVVDSSYMLDPKYSDLSQNEEDRSCLLPSTPKLELGDYPSTSSSLSFPAIWSWSF